MATNYPVAEEYLKRFPVENRKTEMQSYEVIRDLVRRYAIPSEIVEVQDVCDATGHINDIRTVHALISIYKAYMNTPTHYTSDLELPHGTKPLLEELADRWTTFILTGEYK